MLVSPDQMLFSAPVHVDFGRGAFGGPHLILYQEFFYMEVLGIFSLLPIGLFIRSVVSVSMDSWVFMLYLKDRTEYGFQVG